MTDTEQRETSPDHDESSFEDVAEADNHRVAYIYSKRYGILASDRRAIVAPRPEG